MSGPLARLVNYRMGQDGMEIILRLGPKTSKEKLEAWLGEGPTLLQLSHAPKRPESNTASKPKGGNLARLAGQWCKEKSYHQFCLEKGFISVIADRAEQIEKDVTYAIYRECEIKSRAELDHNEQAAKTFKRVFIRPYAEFLQGHKS